MQTPSKKRNSTAISPGEDSNNSKLPTKTFRLYEQIVNNDNCNGLSTVDEEIAKEAKKQQAKLKYMPRIYNNTSKPGSASQKGRMSSGQPPADTSTTSFLTPNRYNILNKENNEDDDQLTESETESVQEKNNNIRNTNKQPRVRIPPIHIKTDSIRTVIELLSNEEKTKKFTIKTTEPNSYSVHATDLETHINIQNALKNNGVEYYTFSTNNKRNKLLVLKGLNSAYTAEEVHEELTQLLNKENIKIVKVDKLLPSILTNNHLLIQFQPECDTRVATKIKSIAHQRVRWELYRKNKVFQCFNCQRVGHSSSNCNLQYRCVKCTVQHAPGKCQLHLQPEDQKKPKCVNCNENHPANYRGCRYIREAQDKIKH